jgi:hypothetical protein
MESKAVAVRNPNTGGFGRRAQMIAREDARAQWHPASLLEGKKHEIRFPPERCSGTPGIQVT